MIQPCVLPSNASPLVSGSEAAPRVLQEHSGNRQHDFKFSQDYELKGSGSLLSENIHPRIPVRPQPLYRHQHAVSHAPFRSGFARPNYGRLHHPTQAEKDERARILLRRFHNSEQYAKYRSRQGKTEGKDGDQKWPDHLEQAFFRGTYFSVLESMTLTGSQL
jgi:transcriptional enhancer factor